MTRDEVQELAERYGQQIPLLQEDMYDSAIAGYHVDADDNVHIVYSYEGLIKALVEVDGISEEDAIDHYEFNIVRSLYTQAPNEPMILHTTP